MTLKKREFTPESGSVDTYAMERKKRSKCSVWEFWFANKIFGTFQWIRNDSGGQKLVKCCTLTHIHTTAAKLVVRMGVVEVEGSRMTDAS